MIQVSRRRFLAGMVGLIAAPAVVKIANLMPVRAYVDLKNDPLAFVEMTRVPSLEEWNLRIAHTFLYGNPAFNPLQLQGFRPFYDTVELPGE